MATLQELNNFSDGVLTYTDNRPSNVIFTYPSAVDIVVDLTTENFPLQRSIDIQEIVQPTETFITFKVDVSSLDGAVAIWSTLPAGVTKTTISSGVYLIQGIDSISDWEAIRTPTIYIPSGSQGGFEYTCTIEYTNNGVRKSQQWTVGAFKPVANLSASATLTATGNIQHNTASYLFSAFTMNPVTYDMLVIGTFTITATANAIFDGVQSLSSTATLTADVDALPDFGNTTTTFTTPYNNSGIMAADQYQVFYDTSISPNDLKFTAIHTIDGLDYDDTDIPQSDVIDDLTTYRADNIEMDDLFLAFFDSNSKLRLYVRTWNVSTDISLPYASDIASASWWQGSFGGVDPNASYSFHTTGLAVSTPRHTTPSTALNLDKIVTIDSTQSKVWVFYPKNDGGVGVRNYLYKEFENTISGVSDFKLVAASQDYYVASTASTEDLYVWDMSNGSLLRTITLSYSNPDDLAIYGDKLLVADASGSEVFDLTTGSSVGTLGAGTSCDCNEDFFVIGNPSANTNSGEIYVYDRNYSLWRTIQNPAGTGSADEFGFDVAISKRLNRMSNKSKIIATTTTGYDVHKTYTLEG